MHMSEFFTSPDNQLPLAISIFLVHQLLVKRTRVLAIVRALEPVRFIQVIIDTTILVRSLFWDGRRMGPDFIYPMSSLTKSQSGHLAKLLLEYSKSLSKFELDNTAVEVPSDGSSVRGTGQAAISDSMYPKGHPQAVIVVDLDEAASNDIVPGEVPCHRHESQYTTSADFDLMVLIPMLLSLLVFLKTGHYSPALELSANFLLFALILGPGTLTLVQRTARHPAELDPGDGCAVLMDDDLTAVIQGSQRIVEAITEGGFRISSTEHQSHPRAEDQMQAFIPVTERLQKTQESSDIIYGMVEGLCRGECFAVVMQLLHLKFAVPFLREVAFVVVFGCMITKARWWRLQGSTIVPLPPIAGVRPARSVARLTGGFVGLVVAVACLALGCSVTRLLGAMFVAQTSYLALCALCLQSPNYRIRTDRFLDALDRPPVRKWLFLTRASAATFVCLVLCRDTLRPVKNIDVLGVLDTLIPNQRDIWRVWKERVADRIVHEERINFAPTLPTFPDERQERLKRLLDEAQIGYDKYLSLPTRKRRSRVDVQES